MNIICLADVFPLKYAKIIMRKGIIMKNDNAITFEKKLSFINIIANQHPVINCWIVFNAAAIIALYALM